jgi:endonuclease III
LPRISEILDTLESFYGKQRSDAPADPYEFLVWWHCGYPASEERCAKGWQLLTSQIGVAPKLLLAAKTSKLVGALRAGGMVPELRAARLKEIAGRVRDEFAGDLRLALSSLPVPQARKILKTFPGVGNPGAERILLFAKLAPAAAVPSSCPQVLVRIEQGAESPNYAANYSAAQAMLEALPATFSARSRAYLLVNRHGHELCKRSKPACTRCPLQSNCAFAKQPSKLATT